MSRFKWLVECEELIEEIQVLEFKLQRAKKELIRWVGGDLSRYKLHPDSQGARQEEKVADIEYELAHKMNDLHDLKQMILRFRGVDSKIVYHHYVEGMQLDKIAELYKYSAQYMYNRHAEIKKMMRFAEAVSV